MKKSEPRPLRMDALVNEDRLLSAAARIFARDGAEASLKAIAEDAGVGIATLFRRFPTREALVAATYDREVDRLCQKAAELGAKKPPAVALRTWMGAFVELLTMKHGMADVLRVALAGKEDHRLETRARLTEALGGLLDGAREHRVVRSDCDATDVLMAIGGIALIAGAPEQRAQAGRLLDLLFDGLRFVAPTVEIERHSRATRPRKSISK